jgi:excisionase family DNA binding protein
MKKSKPAGAPAKARASTPPPSPLRSVAEVAELLGVHPKTAWRLVDRGDLAALRIGRSRRVSERDLQAYLARCR